MSDRRDSLSDLTMEFPEGFRWGASTSAYQIEGAAREDGKGESIWDRFSHTPEKILNGDTGDIACDHYHRYPQDIELLKELGVGAYRFSISWPRILPSGSGQINRAGLDFYDRLVDSLLQVGIEPWPTLYHWDLPQALQDKGGWTHEDIVGRFVDYTDAVVRRLGDRVSNWFTINEPWVISTLGHLWGIHAPGHHDLAESLHVAHNLLLAHGAAIEPVRDAVPNAKVGIVLNLAQTYPDSDSSADEEAAHRADGGVNRWYLDPLYRRHYPEDMVAHYGDAMPEIGDDDFAIISRKTDFLGINTYSPFYVKADPASPGGIAMVEKEGEKTAMGWLVDPEAFQELLVRVHDDYGPKSMLVTENGAAYHDAPPENGRVQDEPRTRYLHDHILAARRAMDQDVPLDGYFVWSFLDNFEWNSGFRERFGIVHVDFNTLERTIKDSGRWYSEVARSNALLPIKREGNTPKL